MSSNQAVYVKASMSIEWLCDGKNLIINQETCDFMGLNVILKELNNSNRSFQSILKSYPTLKLQFEIN